MKCVLIDTRGRLLPGVYTHFLSRASLLSTLRLPPANNSLFTRHLRLLFAGFSFFLPPSADLRNTTNSRNWLHLPSALRQPQILGKRSFLHETNELFRATRGASRVTCEPRPFAPREFGAAAPQTFGSDAVLKAEGGFDETLEIPSGL